MRLAHDGLGWRGIFSAVGFSLAVATAFVVLLGVVFLPHEAALLLEPPHVSVRQCVVGPSGQDVVSLLWTMPCRGSGGSRRLLTMGRLGGSFVTPPAWQHLHATCAEREGSRLLVGDLSGNLWALDLENPQQPPAALARQPDGGVVELVLAGDLLVSRSGQRVFAWEAAGGAARWQRSEPGLACLASDAAGGALFFGTERGEVVEIDPQTGMPLRTICQVATPVVAIAVHPHGRQLAVLDDEGYVRLVNRATGATQWCRQREAKPGGARVAVFSPCGRFLATSAGEGLRRLIVWDVASGNRRLQLDGHRGAILGAAFQGDDRLVSWGTDGTIRTWSIHRRTSGQVCRLAGVAAAARGDSS